MTRRTLGDRVSLWALAAPALLLYLGFFVLPAALGFGYAFTDWSGWSLDPRFIGLDNFRELATDARFLSALKFTAYETVLLVLAFTFGALLLAVLLDRLRRLRSLIAGLFFYPYVLSLVIAGLLWQYVANYREGALNQGLRSLGLESWTQDWMGDPRWTPYFVLAMAVWSGIGFFTTIYMANLRAIPIDLFEAMSLESRSAWARLRHIQFPMLRPAVTVASVMALIFGINLFGQIVVTTQGGPGYRTFTVGYHIYWLGVLNNRQGYAAALSLVLFVGLLAIAAIQVRLLRRAEVQA